jgi:hypothetical protein
VRHRCAMPVPFTRFRARVTFSGCARESNQREDHPQLRSTPSHCEPSLVQGVRPGIHAGRSTPFDMRFNACRKHGASPLQVRARWPLVGGRPSMAVRRLAAIQAATLRAFRAHRSPPLRGPNINRSALPARRGKSKSKSKQERRSQSAEARAQKPERRSQSAEARATADGRVWRLASTTQRKQEFVEIDGGHFAFGDVAAEFSFGGGG